VLDHIELSSALWIADLESDDRLCRTTSREGARLASFVLLGYTGGPWVVENPGLVLGLDAGGDCTGVAFRIAGNVAEAELTTIWKREMLAASYIPRWLDLHDEQGILFGCGLAFTINPTGQNYAGEFKRGQIVARLATACGALGSSADYLYDTCKGLREHAIADPELEALETEVSAYLIPGELP
jgi:glutathione-specific gamma-glutamylcyclotransferase